jgi:hypothetical protein
MTPVGGKEIKKYYICALFKLCCEMKKMIGISGTHGINPMTYVDQAKAGVTAGAGVHRLALFYFYCKCEDNLFVDDKFTVGIMPEDLKGSSTNTEVVDLADGEASIARTVASRTVKNKQQSLDTSTAAFQLIAITLASKEAREAKEEIKKGRLELLRMDDISPCTKKRIKSKVLEHYSIAPTPIKRAATKSSGEHHKSLSSFQQEEEVSSGLTVHSSSDDDSV